MAATAANERASVTSPTKSEVSMDIADISASSDPHSCDPEVTAAVEEYTKGGVTKSSVSPYLFLLQPFFQSSLSNQLLSPTSVRILHRHVIIDLHLSFFVP